MLQKIDRKIISEATDEIDHREESDIEEDLLQALDWECNPQKARDALERYRLKRALSETNGKVTDVADLWEVTKRAVYKMCYKHELKPKDFRKEDAD